MYSKALLEEVEPTVPRKAVETILRIHICTVSPWAKSTQPAMPPVCPSGPMHRLGVRPFACMKIRHFAISLGCSRPAECRVMWIGRPEN